MSENKTIQETSPNLIKIIEYIINTKILAIILFLLTITVVYKTFCPTKYDTLFNWLATLALSLPNLLTDISSSILSIVLEILMLIFLFSILSMFILACFSATKYPFIKTYITLLKQVSICVLLLYSIGISINYLVFDVNIIVYMTNTASIWEQIAISLFVILPIIIILSNFGRQVFMKWYDVE